MTKFEKVNYKIYCDTCACFVAWALTFQAAVEAKKRHAIKNAHYLSNIHVKAIREEKNDPRKDIS